MPLDWTEWIHVSGLYLFAGKESVSDARYRILGSGKRRRERRQKEVVSARRTA